MRRPSVLKQRGFTLTELVAVLLIAGILAVFATSVFDRGVFDTASFADEVRAQMAFAQKTAVAARRNVRVNIGGNSLTFSLCQDFGCSNLSPLPTLRGQASLTPPSGSTVTVAGSPTSFFFNASGTATANVTVTITGAGSQVINVVANTGYVY